MDCSPSGSSVHGIFQAKVLEWGAIAFSIYELNIPKYKIGLPWWLSGKESAYNAGDMGLILGSG